MHAPYTPAESPSLFFKMGVFTLLNPSLCIRIAPSVYTLDTPPPKSRQDLVSLQHFQVRFQSHVGIHPSIAPLPCYLQGTVLSLLAVFLHFRSDLTISLQVQHQRCVPLRIHLCRNGRMNSYMTLESDLEML